MNYDDELIQNIKGISSVFQTIVQPIQDLNSNFKNLITQFTSLISILKTSVTASKSGGFGQNLAADLLGFQIARKLFPDKDKMNYGDARINAITSGHGKLFKRLFPSWIQDRKDWFEDKMPPELQMKLFNLQGHLMRAAGFPGKVLGNTRFGKFVTRNAEGIYGDLERTGAIKNMSAFGSLIGSLKGITTIFGALAAAAIMFKDTMVGLAEGLVRSGASMSQMGAFHGMAGAMGIGDADLGRKIQSFGHLISQGGIAGGIASQMGIHPYGGLGGDQNVFNKYRTALKNIVFDTDERSAGIKARYLGLEDMSYLRYADTAHKNMFLMPIQDLHLINILLRLLMLKLN